MPGVGIESKKIAEGLCGDNSPRDSVVFANDFLEDGFEIIPAAATQVGAVILGILCLSMAIYSRDVGHDRLASGSESSVPYERYCKLN